MLRQKIQALRDAQPSLPNLLLRLRGHEALESHKTTKDVQKNTRYELAVPKSMQQHVSQILFLPVPPPS